MIGSGKALSVITVTFQNLNGLEKTAFSLNQQTARDRIQWVVIDGGSTDGTSESIQHFIRPGDRWISEKDHGLYHAMNKGIDLSDGAFLWFLNAGDTCFDNTTTEHIIDNLHGIDLLYGDTALLDKNGSYIGLRSRVSSRKLPDKLSLSSMKYGMVVNHQSIILRKNYSAYFDQNYPVAADYNWLCEALKKNPYTKKHHSPISYFEEGGLSSQKKRDSWIERFHIMKRHFGFLPTTYMHFLFIFRALFTTLRNMVAPHQKKPL
jgi:glycosyltransferase involved in cell wall biosynthesis